jgi:XRE family transcriptional regulator, regulator of sulfur utilization
MPRRSPQADSSRRALGRAIRQARVEQQLTQENLAYDSGFGWSEISRLESGLRNPTFGTLKRLSKGLDMPLWRLILMAEEIEKADENL